MATLNGEKPHDGITTSPERSNAPIWRRAIDLISYTPKRCRWDPDNPPKFTLALNVLFGVAATATVADLYYSHPILNILAEDFGVSYESASIIPTLAQAGYAGGLLFVCPLGDLFKRRPLVLWLVWITGTLWIGLCVTKSFVAFGAISFLTGVTTVTPQLMLPLVGQLAPAHRRATAISIVVSGLLLGMLIARVLAGIVTNFTSWQVVYWIAFALQYLVLILLWLFMPDYPSSNPGGLNYFKTLWSILVIIKNEPVLVQACLIGFCTSATFTSFWTTLTFLLAGAPYHYSSLEIGCFAFIGIGAMTLGPPVARFFVDRFHPLLSVIIGETVCLVSNAIGAYTGTITVAGPVIQAFGLDIGLQTSQISNRTAIYAINQKAQNRINTAYMVSVFLGQVTGTAVGNHLYAEAGWIGSGTYNVASIGAALFFCLVRGPRAKGWIGWPEGANFKRVVPKPAEDEEKNTLKAEGDVNDGKPDHGEANTNGRSGKAEGPDEAAASARTDGRSTPSGEELSEPEKLEAAE